MKDLDKLLEEQEEGRKGYNLINKALKQELKFDFSGGFVENIFSKIDKEEKKSAQRYWLVMGALVLSFLGLGFGSILYFVGLEGFSKMYNITIYATIAGLMVVLVQYLDDKLINKVQLSKI